MRMQMTKSIGIPTLMTVDDIHRMYPPDVMDFHCVVWPPSQCVVSFDKSLRSRLQCALGSWKQRNCGRPASLSALSTNALSSLELVLGLVPVMLHVLLAAIAMLLVSLYVTRRQRDRHAAAAARLQAEVLYACAPLECSPRGRTLSRLPHAFATHKSSLCLDSSSFPHPTQLTHTVTLRA